MVRRSRTRRPIWDYSVCLENFLRKIEINLKISPDAPKNESGLTQMIMMGKSIRQIWVKLVASFVGFLIHTALADTLKPNNVISQP